MQSVMSSSQKIYAKVIKLNHEKKTNHDFAIRKNFDSSDGIFTLINSQNDNF